jgi:hypothetical protein
MALAPLRLLERDQRRLDAPASVVLFCDGDIGGSVTAGGNYDAGDFSAQRHARRGLAPDLDGVRRGWQVQMVSAVRVGGMEDVRDAVGWRRGGLLPDEALAGPLPVGSSYRPPNGAPPRKVEKGALPWLADAGVLPTVGHQVTFQRLLRPGRPAGPTRNQGMSGTSRPALGGVGQEAQSAKLSNAACVIRVPPLVDGWSGFGE